MDKQPMSLIHTCCRSIEGESRSTSKRILVIGRRVSKSWVRRWPEVHAVYCSAFK